MSARDIVGGLAEQPSRLQVAAFGHRYVAIGRSRARCTEHLRIHVPDDKLAEALSKVAGRLQEAAGAGRGAEPGQSDCESPRRTGQARNRRWSFPTRSHELLRQATQAQIAAAQGARKLREQAQEAEGREAEPPGDSGGIGGSRVLNERGRPFNPKSVAAMLAS